MKSIKTSGDLLHKFGATIQLRVLFDREAVKFETHLEIHTKPENERGKFLKALQPQPNRFRNLATKNSGMAVFARTPSFDQALLKFLAAIMKNHGDPILNGAELQSTHKAIFTGVADAILEGKGEAAQLLLNNPKPQHGPVRVFAVALANAAKAENTLQDAMKKAEKHSPTRQTIKVDAAKVGTASVHTIANVLEVLDFGSFDGQFFEADTTTAIAFTIDPFFMVVGKKPIPAMRQFLTA